MSAYTRKQTKAEKRAKELEDSRALLSVVFTGCEAVLDHWTARNFLAFIQRNQRLPFMNNQTFEFFVNSIQRDPLPFTREDVKERISMLTSSKRFANTVYNDATGRISEYFSYWSCSELMELIDFYQMVRSSEYIKAVLKLSRWSQDRNSLKKFRYEDVEAAMNMARVKHVMER